MSFISPGISFKPLLASFLWRLSLVIWEGQRNGILIIHLVLNISIGLRSSWRDIYTISICLYSQMAESYFLNPRACCEVMKSFLSYWSCKCTSDIKVWRIWDGSIICTTKADYINEGIIARHTSHLVRYNDTFVWLCLSYIHAKYITKI